MGILLGIGDGRFLAAVRYSTVDAFAFTLTPGDFNGDGKLDLAVGNTNCEDLRESCGVSSPIAILLGKGDGTFATAVTYPSGDSLWPPPQKAGVDSNAIAASDLNGDGKVDLALSDKASCWVTATELSRRPRATTPLSPTVFPQWWPTSTRTGNLTWL